MAEHDPPDHPEGEAPGPFRQGEHGSGNQGIDRFPHGGGNSVAVYDQVRAA
jgi:hypothetical protein